MEAGFDRIIDSLEDLKAEVRRVDQKHAGLENRIGDIERQVIDTRDEMQRRAVTPAPSQIASAKKAIRDSAKSPVGVIAAVCIFITTISAAGGGIPKLVQGAERFWHFLAGRDVAGIARPQAAKSDAVPK